MKDGIMFLGSDTATVLAAAALSRSGFKVNMVSENNVLGTDCHIHPTGGVLRPRQQLPFELDLLFNRNMNMFLGTRIQNIRQKDDGLKITLEKVQNYVDGELCSACGKCEEACPVEIDGHKAIYSYGKNRVPASYFITRSGIPPCMNACPAGVNVQGYIALIRAGKFQEALSLERECNPFANVCGRVCHRPCESACIRGLVDESLAIRDLKRFIAESGESGKKRLSAGKVRHGGREPLKIAVVGAGPAGLTCAKLLDSMGYEVTIFEALSSPGGMLSWAIPEFRLPRDILKRDLDFIISPEMKIVTNSFLGRDFTINSLKEEGFNAIFVAIGAQGAVDVDFPGKKKCPQIMNSLEFLKLVDKEKKINIGRRIIIIGGGNSAVDAARSALRMGCDEVIITYRRTRAEMPAGKEEVNEAMNEGIRLMELTSPLEFIWENERLEGLKIIRNTLVEDDDSGRKKNIPIPGTEAIIQCDTIITAFGQQVNMQSVENSGLALTEEGTIAADLLTCQTNIPGVFAGGDAVTGATTVVQAVAAGRNAAGSIDSYLRGIEIPFPPESYEYDDERREQLKKRANGVSRLHRKTIPMEKRINTFNEVENTFLVEDALKEASRCLNCADCSLCGECARICREVKAINYNTGGKEIDLRLSGVILQEKESVNFKDFNGKGIEIYQSVRSCSELSNVARKSLNSFFSYFSLPGKLDELDDATLIKAYYMICEAGKLILPSLYKAYAGMSSDLTPPTLKKSHITGIYVCHCGEKLAGIKSNKSIYEIAELCNLDIRRYREFSNLCSEETLKTIEREVREKDLTRILIGACACCETEQICEGCCYQRVRLRQKIREKMGKLDISLGFFNVRELFFWNGRKGNMKDYASLLRLAIEKSRLCERMMKMTYNVERGVVLFYDRDIICDLASLLSKQGYDTALIVEKKHFKEKADLRNVTVIDDIYDYISWEKGNFSLYLRKGKRINAGVVVTMNREIVGSTGTIIESKGESARRAGSFIQQVMEKNCGVFPGLFMIDDFRSLPEDMIKTLPYFLNVSISSYLGNGQMSRYVLDLHRNEDLCRSCGKCVEACPYSYIWRSDDQMPLRSSELCESCGLCVEACDTGSLQRVPDEMNSFEKLLETVIPDS